jgi:hypothetical protein
MGLEALVQLSSHKKTSRFQRELARETSGPSSCFC